MTKSEAEHLRQVALNALDLAHCLHTGTANKITFQAWWDEFARGKEFEAARKQWLRWKTDFKEFGVPCDFVDEGREKHVIVTRHTIEAAERLLADAEAVLGPDEEAPRRYPDFVTIKGKTYRLKVYGRDIRPLTEREYAELKASVEVDGIRVAIFVDRDGNVIDGKHRLMIAVELGLEVVPIIVLDEADRAKLDDLAVKLNECRRQFTRKELAERRRLRQQRALEKRAAGMSTHQIAEEEKVTQTMIRKDLDAAGGEVDTEVVGKDGRRHRSRQRTEDEQAERRQQIAALRAENPRLTVREIAEELELSPSTVARELEALEAVAAAPPAVVVPRRTGPILGVDPEEDDLKPCLEAVITGLERIREGTRGTGLEELVGEVHGIVDTLIWRLVEAEVPA